MNIKKHRSLYRVIGVFVAGLFLFVLTACGNTPKVLASDTLTTRSNKPVDVMQPSDIQQRHDVSAANEKAEALVTGAKRNLEKHGNYQGTNNPLESERTLSERAGDIQNKAGEGVKYLRENLENTAQDTKSSLKGIARSAKTAADDVSNKAQRAANDARYRTLGDD